VRGRPDAGSATIEGLVAMAVFFLLMVLIAQIGFLLLTHSTLSAAVESAARRGAADPDAVLSIEDGLRVDLESTIPGASIEAVSVARQGDRVVAMAGIRWTPPGPDLIPIRMRVMKERVAMVPP
jgi:hypothetical protein